ncbi:G-PROTEIN-RECEP-F1-2 domain-containing protein [Aphelenchoides besseyi]|nr:G-PROTEIN-RECEP-F1-2 domain-containing protein [Aphelenchoides besseyi]
MGQPLKELVDNVQDDYDTHSMSSSNVTLNTILTVQAPYETSAWINLSAVIWGFPLNLLILVIGFKKKNLQNSYLFTVLCMTFCQFYAVLMESALYIFYLIALNQRWQMTLLTCSIIRRFLQTSMTPANLSTLILSIDRYIFILHSKKIRSPIIGFVFGLTFVYSHFIYFPLQIFGRYGSSDICGPALGMSPSIGYFVQPIEPICICIAFFVNLRIVLFISKQRTSKAMALRGIRKREFKEMRFAMFGLLIQSLVPFVFALPQTVNLAAYNIGVKSR